MLIPVDDADQPGAVAIGHVGHRARNRRLLDIERQHDHVLSGLDRRADADRQLGQPLHPGIHGPILYDGAHRGQGFPACGRAERARGRLPSAP